MKVVTVACKCDLEGRVKPRAVVKQIKPCGLVEVEYSSKAGKNKMRSLVDWTLRQLVSSVNGATLQPYLKSIPNQEPDELIPHAINAGRPEERPLVLHPDAIADASASSLASTTTQLISFDLPAAGKIYCLKSLFSQCNRFIDRLSCSRGQTQRIPGKKSLFPFAPKFGNWTSQPD
jgi:hypothetical protein